jgi:hypothetical protein
MGKHHRGRRGRSDKAKQTRWDQMTLKHVVKFITDAVQDRFMQHDVGADAAYWRQSLLDVEWIREDLISCYFDDEGIHAHATSRLAKLPRNILEATYAFANRNIKDWDLWVDEWQSAGAGGGSVTAGELVAPSSGCEPAAAAVAAPASPESLGTAESAAAAPASSSEVSAAVAWAVASAADAGPRACDPLDS